MNKFVVIEVGSTTTKSNIYDNGVIKDLNLEIIEFKNHYKELGKIDDSDKQKLFNFVNSIKKNNVFIYGTSIFRNLTNEQKEEWLKEFKDNTGYDFEIVTPDMENEYTVYGVINDIKYKGNIAVMIGGGGSTELSIVKDNNVIEECNSSFGAMDVTYMFPELKEDKAYTDYETMVREVKKLVNIPKNKAELLVLAGGDYLYFYDTLKYPVEKNKFYNNKLQPYCIDSNTMDILDKRFFYDTSLNEVISKNDKEAWWKGSRGMRLCVKALVDILEVKYIIPTRINMIYGIVEKLKDR